MENKTDLGVNKDNICLVYRSPWLELDTVRITVYRYRPLCRTGVLNRMYYNTL